MKDVGKYNIYKGVSTVLTLGAPIVTLFACGDFFLERSDRTISAAAVFTILVVLLLGRDKLAEKMNKARMLAVTCMEVENSDFYRVFTEMKTSFGPTVCPIVVPYDKNGPVEAYINLLTMKAYKYDKKGVPTEVEMPASENRIAGLRAAMAEAVAETNEEFMDKFFNEEEFTHEELVKGIHDGVANGTYIIRLAIAAFTSGKMTNKNWNITRTSIFVETLTLKFSTRFHKAHNF